MILIQSFKVSGVRREKVWLVFFHIGKHTTSLDGARKKREYGNALKEEKNKDRHYKKGNWCAIEWGGK